MAAPVLETEKLVKNSNIIGLNVHLQLKYYPFVKKIILLN